jgi:hypothetical protein
MEKKTELRIIEKEDVKKKDERVALVHLFNIEFEKECGKKNPLPYGACMRAMQFFKYNDEETGEIITSYPDIDSWKDQLTGFFKDDFARQNRGFHFTYFLKQFGSFHKPVARQKEIKHKPIMINCDNCKKPRQPFGVCEHCGV